MLAVSVFLHNTLHKSFLSETGNKLVLAFSFFLFDDEHSSLIRLPPN